MKLKSLFSLLLIGALAFTPFQASAATHNTSINLDELKVGDITEHGIVTAIDENGYFFKIIESDESVSSEANIPVTAAHYPGKSYSGTMSGTFDNSTILNDTAYYFGGTAVCKNLYTGSSSTLPVQFKLGNTAVGVPAGSGYSFVGMVGYKLLTVQAIEEWGYRTVTWEILE